MPPGSLAANQPGIPPRAGSVKPVDKTERLA
jgi:hypothetical protein